MRRPPPSPAARLLLAASLARALTACGGDEPPELQLVVTGDARTTEIQLYFASEGSLGGELQPAGATARIRGDVFPRDPSLSGDLAEFRAVVDAAHTARFVLRAGEASKVKALIALGRDAQGAITSAAVAGELDASKGPLRVVMPLAPVTSPELGTATVDDVHAAVWGEDRVGAPGCVGVSVADVTTFIVPADDRDCDGHEAAGLECDEVVFDAESVTAYELLHIQDAAGRETCRPVTKAGCTDGQASDDRIEPICLPDLLCDNGCQPTGEGGVSCVDAITLPDLAGMPHLACTVYVQDALAGAPGALCATLPSPVDLRALFSDDPNGSPAVTCSKVEFAPIGASGAAPSDALILSTGVRAVAEVRQDFESACAFSLLAEQNAPALTTAAPLQVARLTASDDGDEIVLPVKLRREAGCPAGQPPIHCVFVGVDGGAPDGVTACARTPTP